MLRLDWAWRVSTQATCVCIVQRGWQHKGNQGESNWSAVLPCIAARSQEMAHLHTGCCVGLRVAASGAGNMLCCAGRPVSLLKTGACAEGLLICCSLPRVGSSSIGAVFNGAHAGRLVAVIGPCSI